LVLPAQTLTREGNRWVMTLTGNAPALAQLRVNAQGPVQLEGGVGREISYTAKLSIRARNEQEARRLLSQYTIPIRSLGDMVLINSSGGPVTEYLAIKAPRLSRAFITTADGDVEANGIDGSLHVESAGGILKCDRIHGSASLNTGGGDIRVGEVSGDVRCATGGGAITVKTAHGSAVLQTGGGDIDLGEADGAIRAETGGGAVRIGGAGAEVLATTGGGSIAVGRAGGFVTARNVAGPVQIGAAAGVRCESGSGTIHLSNVSGPMRVSTAVGNIVAALTGGSSIRQLPSFLETGNGDITVTIPSNLGVTIMAESQRRIVSDFPTIGIEMRGPQFVAQGAVNGGGPVLRVSGEGGTVYLRRQ
jgi:hypothetical protein